MNKFDLALNLIRPTTATKLQDRAWIFPVLLAVAVMVGGFTDRMKFETAVYVAAALISPMSIMEKLKDALLGSAALKSAVPDVVAAGTVVNNEVPPVNADEQTNQTPARTRRKATA